jgi:hypothetical protein
MENELAKANKKIVKSKKYGYMYSLIFVLIFMLIVFIPITLSIFSTDWTPTMKNTLLSSINKSTNVSGAIETQFNNSFLMKDNLIRTNTALKYFLFNTSTNSKVLAGKGGWFFSAKSENTNSLEDFEGNNLFTNAELEQIKSNLLKFNEISKKRGAVFSLVIVPSKYDVYNEFLPNNVIKNPTQSRLLQVEEYINKNTDIKVVDLSEELIKNKGETNLYCKTSSLWNDLGAFYGYKKIAEDLKIENIYYNDLSDYTVNTESNPGMELVQQLKLQNLITEKYVHTTPKENYSWKKTSNDDKFTTYSNSKASSGSMLMLTDEFGSSLQPYLSQNFSNSYYKNEYVIDESFIVNKNIKNLILEISENNLENLLSANIASTTEQGNTYDINNIPNTPTIISKSIINPDTVVIIGKGTDNSIITASGGKNDVSTNVVDGTFMIEVKLLMNQQNTVTIKSKNANGQESNPVIVNVTPDQNAAIKPIVVGKNNFMYLSDDVADVTGTNLFTTAQLEQIKNKLENYQTYMNEKVPNSKLILFAAPDKMSVYPEYKPDYITKNNQTRMNQLMNYLKHNSSIIVVDATSTLINNKNQELLYYRTDSHWNELGAFYGYSALINEVKKYSPNVKPLRLMDFKISRVRQKGGDLTTYINNTNSFIKEDEVRLIPNFTKQSNLVRQKPMSWLGFLNNEFTTTINNSTFPKGVIIRDSYTTNMMPYLSENFQQLTYEAEWSYGLNKQYVDDKKPDFVIIELVERNLNQLLN